MSVANSLISSKPVIVGQYACSKFVVLVHGSILVVALTTVILWFNFDCAFMA